jgi:hypothetical protein
MPAGNGVTPEAIAQWMAGELERDGFLRQRYAAYEIIERFGAEFTYVNRNGNPAIDKEVLAAFREMTAESVIWIGGRVRGWRKREPGDPPGRRAP